jgi:hypothetical protein
MKPINRQDAKSAKKGVADKSIWDTENISSLKSLIRTWRAWRLGGEKELCL